MAERDALTMDISRDLERIDAAMTKVILDDSLSEEFRRDPNAVLVRVGMHPPTTKEVNDRVNRIFYAAATNTELNQMVSEHFRSFKPARADEYARHHLEGLEQGRIQNMLELDLEAANHLFENEEVLTRVLRTFLHDLNAKHILVKEHTREDIDKFVSVLVRAIRDRRPISEHPKLEEWDRNYGVGGYHFGAEAVEVGPVATAYVAVELGAFVTVAVTERTSEPLPSPDKVLAGDRAALVRLATTSKILKFRSDLMFHAFQFEGRR